ncbi:MAG: nickel pincer cofactor biosynthesis protein LarB [Coriobacteriales bacterium]|nr:nickel pincer cofactor biosynthesis protein LarB [Coriobacteriales bacterium]
MSDGTHNLDDFAHLDYAREERCGFPEVIFGAGKTPEQVAAITQALLREHDVVLATRATGEQAAALVAVVPDVQYVASCGVLYVDRRKGAVRMTGDTAAAALALGAPGSAGGAGASGGAGHVVVCCAGTSDLAVAQEAALTARIMGSAVTLLADIGIAGVHRVLGHTNVLHSAHVIVAVAGMEGALPSLVAGLVDVPVIAVPTSVGYGASFGGIAALLGMLNSCAGGVSVVNIDNGFGAGQIAHRINVPPVRFVAKPGAGVEAEGDVCKPS